MIHALPRDPWGRDLQGKTHSLTFESRFLAGNPLGNPASRPLTVYTPPGYPAQGPYPAIWMLQGFSGQMDMWGNRTAYEPTLLERIDAAIAKGVVPPVVLVLPDAWSSYGGTQFLDSAGVGQYRSYLCDELVPLVGERFEVHKTKDGRAAMGNSSGGYGALMMALDRPDIWGAVGALAPDAAFEYCYLLDFPIAWKTLRTHQGSVDTFWSMVRAKDRPSGDDFTTLNAVAMAACYSPGANGEPELPWDERTGAVRPEVWARWLEHDPVRVLPRKLEAARGLRALSIECGLRDEYRLYAGAQMLHTQLNDARIDHRFEFFDGTHASMQHRYPATIAYLATRLTG